MKALYTAISTADGREGHVKSDDGIIDLPLVNPPGLGGKGGTGTNPEQLFASGYAACFTSAMKVVAGRQKLETGPLSVTAHVTIGRGDSGLELAVVLHVHAPEMPREAAEALIAAAHQVCPYSKATRNNVPVELVLD